MEKRVSIREASVEYKHVLELYHPLEEGKVNCYVCDCGHITKTIEVDNGVTPAFYKCEECGKMAHSSFYKDVAKEQKPTWEWYRPSLKETLRLRKKDMSTYTHVIMGGLLPREIVMSAPVVESATDPTLIGAKVMAFKGVSDKEWQTP